MTRIDFRLILITDRHVLGATHALPLQDAVEQALRGGVPCVQLREKDLPVRELLALAYEMRELTNRYGARLIINDRADVAVAVGADGVHLGRESLPVRAAKNIVGATHALPASGFIIGVSTHSMDEALQAQSDGADYITFGPVYETPSKMRYGPPVGLDALRECCEKINIPVFGLGGIKKDNVHEVMDSGAYGGAVISAILAAEDVKKAAEELMNFM